MSELREIIQECHDFLLKSNETFWSKRLHSVLLESKGGFDRRDLNEIKSWFGGMGSFNDLYFSERNGYVGCAKELAEKNKILNNYRDKIYDLAEIFPKRA